MGFIYAITYFSKEICRKRISQHPGLGKGLAGGTLPMGDDGAASEVGRLKAVPSELALMQQNSTQFFQGNP